jgi:TonB family protein
MVPGQHRSSITPMKLHALPLVALSLLLGACNTTRTTAQSSVPPPVQTGTKVTAWGELPTYDPAGYIFTGMRAPVRAITGTVSLDLKVGFDGRVEDIAVFESSGNTEVDRAIVHQFKKARYTLQLRPEDPAPYVVRLTIHMESGAPSDDHFGHVDPSSHKHLGGPVHTRQ